MTDWIAIARARGLDIPEEALQQRARVMAAFEATFQQAKAGLSADADPAPVFRAVVSAEVES